METKYDVFISYSRKDTEIANKICEALKQQGISYFIDRKGIKGGQEVPELLADAIVNCRIMLYLASINSYNSKYTNTEITFAFNEKPKGSIIPYIIDESNLPNTQRFIFASINIRTIKEHPIETILMQDMCQLLNREYKDENTIKSGIASIHNIDEDTKREIAKEEAKQKVGEDEAQKVKKYTPPKYFKELKLTPVKRKRIIFGLEYGHDLYGYADESGKTVIPYRWKSAYSFSEGLARIESSQGLWGYIYYNGTVVIPCQWQNAMDFSEGFAAVQDSYGKWGFIDRSGNEVMPCVWDLVHPFSEGMAAISSGRLWGFIDNKGKFLSKRPGFPCPWGAVQAFSEGMAAVCTQERWGYINKEDNLVIPTKFKAAGPFSNGKAIVMGPDNKTLVIDKNGKPFK